MATVTIRSLELHKGLSRDKGVNLEERLVILKIGKCSNDIFLTSGAILEGVRIHEEKPETVGCFILRLNHINHSAGTRFIAYIQA